MMLQAGDDAAGVVCAGAQDVHPLVLLLCISTSSVSAIGARGPAPSAAGCLKHSDGRKAAPFPLVLFAAGLPWWRCRFESSIQNPSMKDQ